MIGELDRVVESVRICKMKGKSSRNRKISSMANKAMLCDVTTVIDVSSTAMRHV
jgi:hypothetical protein